MHYFSKVWGRFYNCFYNVIYSCDGKAVTPVFSVTLSLRNHANILILSQETFLIIINADSCC